MKAQLNGMREDYERGRISRRGFIEAATALAALAACAPEALAAPPAAPLQAATVNHIAIGVSDLKRSKEWYTRVMKLKVVQETPNLLLLQFGQTQLVLRPRSAARPTIVPGTISHFSIGVTPYDEAALKQSLLSFGLEPTKDMESFHVRDPDGTDVQIGDAKLGLDVGYPPDKS